MDLDDLYDQLEKAKPLKIKKPTKPKLPPKPKLTKLPEDYFEGKTIVFTGKFEGRTQLEIQDLTSGVGGKLSGSVTQNTDVLVCGGKKVSNSAKSMRALKLPKVDYILESEWEVHLKISELRIRVLGAREQDPTSVHAVLLENRYLDEIASLEGRIKEKYEYED